LEEKNSIVQYDGRQLKSVHGSINSREWKARKNMAKSKDMMHSPSSEAEYKKLMELLRARLNVLNASVFLLEDNLVDSDYKTSCYIKRINTELERIRKLIIETPVIH